jgi:hypothetical protein
MSKFVRVTLIALTLVIILGSLNTYTSAKKHNSSTNNDNVKDSTPSPVAKVEETHDGSTTATTTTDQIPISPVTESPPPQIPIIGDSETTTDPSTPTPTTNNEPPIQTFPIPPPNTGTECKHLCNYEGGDVKVIKKVIEINIGVSRHTDNNHHDGNNILNIIHNKVTNRNITDIINENIIREASTPTTTVKPISIVTRDTNITNQLTVGEMINGCKGVNPKSPIKLQDNCTVLVVAAFNYCLTHKSITDNNGICYDPLYLSNIPQYIHRNNVNLKAFLPTIYNIVI